MTALIIKNIIHEETLNLPIDYDRGPHTLRLRVKGIIDGAARLEIFSDEGLEHEWIIKKGQVNMAINIEWYSKACYIKYIPSTNVTKGGMKVEYDVKYINGKM